MHPTLRARHRIILFPLLRFLFELPFSEQPLDILCTVSELEHASLLLRLGLLPVLYNLGLVLDLARVRRTMPSALTLRRGVEDE